jgi:hypothetical protein
VPNSVVVEVPRFHNYAADTEPSTAGLFTPKLNRRPVQFWCTAVFAVAQTVTGESDVCSVVRTFAACALAVMVSAPLQPASAWGWGGGGGWGGGWHGGGWGGWHGGWGGWGGWHPGWGWRGCCGWRGGWNFSLGFGPFYGFGYYPPSFYAPYYPPVYAPYYPPPVVYAPPPVYSPPAVYAPSTAPNAGACPPVWRGGRWVPGVATPNGGCT